MNIRSFNELRDLFSNQSTVLWERLGYVRESIKSRGVLGPVRFGEETITDLLLMDLFVQGSTVALFSQTSKPNESIWGTDFELWLGSERLGWLRFAIQAKKLDLRTDRYASLTQSNVNGPQIDLLEQYAKRNGAAPLYCLYNHTDSADELDHWHCCTGPANLKELGCSVTPSSNIRKAIGQWKGKNFHSIHRRKSTLPWKCLVSCPKVWYLLQIMSGDEFQAPIIRETPLFNPDFCYHKTLPMVLRMQDQPTDLRRGERGGSLLSIPLDAEQEIDGTADSFGPEVRTDFRERYDLETGAPKAAAVIEVQGPDLR